MKEKAIYAIFVVLLLAGAIIWASYLGDSMKANQSDIVRKAEIEQETTLKERCLEMDLNGDFAWRQDFCYKLINPKQDFKP